MTAEKLKVLYITTTYPTSDSESTGFFLTNITEGLAPMSVSVTILTNSHSHKKQYSKLDKYGNEVFQLPYSFIFPPMLRDGGIVNAIKKNKFAFVQLCHYFIAQILFLLKNGKNYDVIHGHWLLTGGFIGALVKPFVKKPLVVTAHGAEFYFPKNWFFKAVMKFVISRASKVIFVSKHLVAKAEQWGLQLPAEKTVVLYNCVNVHKFLPSEEKYPKFTFVVLGRLSAEKHIEEAIEAMAKLPKDVLSEATLLVVGHGPEEQRLKRLTEDLGISEVVSFTGYVSNENVPTLLNRAHVYVKTTRQEGFATTNVEAQSLGLPAICTYGSGNDELFVEGKTAYFYTAGDIEQLAEKMLLTFNNQNLLTQLSLNARTNAVNSYSVEIIGQQYAQLYNAIHKITV